MFTVLGLLLSNRISLGKAAELLGLRIDQLWILLRKLGIEYTIYNDEEVEEELEAYQRVFEESRT